MVYYFSGRLIDYNGLVIAFVLNQCLSVNVTTPPGKFWKVLDFFLKIPGVGKSWKINLVLESPGN